MRSTCPSLRACWTIVVSGSRSVTAANDASAAVPHVIMKTACFVRNSPGTANLGTNGGHMATKKKAGKKKAGKKKAGKKKAAKKKTAPRAKRAGSRVVRVPQ